MCPEQSVSFVSSSSEEKALTLVGAFFFLGLGGIWNRKSGSAIREANHDARSAPEHSEGEERSDESIPLTPTNLSLS
jgi:hypothetical protein